MKLCYVAFLWMTARASASEPIHAEEVPQSLDTRASFYGGWPLAATTCPSSTTSCGDGSCCPSSTDCYTQGLAGVAVCCPDGNNCANTANTLPVCANSIWTLYIGNYYYFCCAPGQVGILPDKGSSVAAGLCVDSDVSPAASVRATAYGGASPTTASSSSSTPSVTSTTPSSITGQTSTQNPTTKPSTNSSPVSGSPSMSATSTSASTQPSNSTPHSTSSTGAIAGGAVGGVVGLTLIVLAIWFFGFRRRKNRALTRAEMSDAAGPIEQNYMARDQELNEFPGPIAGNFGYNEMAASEVSPAKGNTVKTAGMTPAELA